MRNLLAAAALLAACSARGPAPSGQVAAAGVGAQPSAAPARALRVTPDAPFRAHAPAPGAPAEFHAPVPRQLRLANGLAVYLIERHELPLVNLALVVRSGADTTAKANAGLASMVLTLLEEGTAARDATSIARGFEDLAARYQTVAEADFSMVRVSLLASTFEPVLDLFADVVLHPAFRAADVERAREQRLSLLAQEVDEPEYTAHWLLARVLFGETHPWAFPSRGTIPSIKAMQPRDLAAWHRAHFVPGNAALFVVGDVTAEKLQAALGPRFGAWEGPAAPRPRPHPAPAAAPRAIYLVDKPGAPQSQIWVGEVGLSATAADFFPAQVMNEILGGGFISSRLSGNLRTGHGWSYGVYSKFVAHREPGMFYASGGVVADKTAESLVEFVKELVVMKTGEVTAAELDDARDGLIRAVPAQFASGEETAGAYARAWADGLPLDYHAHYQARIAAVTRADVARAARERLHPERQAIVVVGPAQGLREKLEALGLGRVELRGATGEPAAAAR